MGITLFTLEGLLGPLHQMVAWLARPRGVRQPSKSRPGPFQPVDVRGRPSWAGAAPGPCDRPRRPLRVVRVVEPHAAASAGRMFMSGRMADVCAELDRLAALEAK